MILTEFDIQQRKHYAEINSETLNGQKLAAVIGHPTEYFFAFRREGEVAGICGVPVKILNMYPKEGGVIGDEDYMVDLAVEARVPEFYTELKGILVTSMKCVSPNGETKVVLCNFNDIGVVNEIMNEKYVRTNGRPKLQLVVNNADNQETPDQQS